METGTNIAALGIVASCVAGLIWVIKRMFNDVVPALNGLKKATEQNTSATKSADDYLQQRNGRDNEHHEATLKSINAIPTVMKTIADAQAEAIIKAVRNGSQHVSEQIVDNQTINKSKRS